MRKLCGLGTVGSAAAMLALSTTLSVTGCGCANDIKQVLPSPDGARQATLFERGCGATSENNLQVSITPIGDALVGRGNVMIVRDTSSRGGTIDDLIRIRWVDARTLTITSDSLLQVSRKEPHADGVNIEYFHAGQAPLR